MDVTRIERDLDNDSAYVYLVDEIHDGEAVAQVGVQPPNGDAEIVLDFDAQGKLLGVEILGASKVMRP